MLEIKRLFKPSVFFFVFSIFSFMIMGIMHEYAHIEINRSYNISSHIDYINYFPSIATVIDDNQTFEYNPNRVLAHDIADAFAYPLFGLFFMVSFGFFVIIYLLEEKL